MSVQGAFMEPGSAETINVQNASYYYSGTSSLNDQIQAILDNAKSGDTILFLGDLYRNLQLTINKNLNILSYTGTEISGSYSVGSAVFLIDGSTASGTQINGFNILNSTNGIVVNNSSYVTISNTNLSSIRESAITINGSFHTLINNSLITRSSTGIDVSNSQMTQINESNISNNKNGVNIDNSANTQMKNSQITQNQQNGVKVSKSTNTTINGSNINDNGNEGVKVSQSNRTIINNSNVDYNMGTGVDVQDSDKFKISNSNATSNFNGVLIQDSTNATIQDNNITGNILHGVYLGGTPYSGPITDSSPGNINTVLIKGNDLSRNMGAGIRYDCYGKYITIRGNVMVGNFNGISYGENYITSQTIIIEHNIITGSGSRDLDSQNTGFTSYLGSNFLGATYWICGVVLTETRLVLVRTGENIYLAYFFDPDSGEIEADFPPTWVTFTTSTGFKALIQTIEGMATVTIDLTSLTGNVTASAYGVSVTMPWNSVIITEESLPKKSAKSDTDWELLDPDTFDDQWEDNPNIPGGPTDPTDPGGPTDPTDPGGPIDPTDPDIPINPNIPSGPTDPSNPGFGGSGNNPGSGGSGNNPGSGGSGNNPGSGSNPDSSSSSNSGTPSSNPAFQPSSVGQLAAAAAVGTIASPGEDGSSNQEGGSKLVQELFVDSTQDSLIYGIIGLIMLIVLVFIAFYRKDLMSMIRKSK